MMRKPSSPFLACIYEQMLAERYAMATINAYIYWIKFFICYHQLHHSRSLGGKQGCSNSLRSQPVSHISSQKPKLRYSMPSILFINLSYSALAIDGMPTQQQALKQSLILTQVADRAFTRPCACSPEVL